MQTPAPPPPPAPIALQALPEVSLLRLALQRKPGLAPGQRLPALVATCPVQLTDDPTYRALCGLPADGPLPLTLPFLLAGPLHKLLLADPRFPLPAMGLVHLRQTLWQAGPLPAGAALVLRCSGGAHRPARRGVEFDLLTELLDGERVVWSGTTTAWSPAGPGHGERGPRETVDPWPDSSSTAVEVPEDMGRRYAKISGDFNPIHWHWLTAYPFGFKRAIIHGMWTLARALASRPGAPVGPEIRVEGRFRKPVPLPSQLRIEWAADGQRGRVWRGDALCLELDLVPAVR